MSRECIKGRAQTCQEAAISREAQAHMSDLLHPLGRRFDEADRRIVNDARKILKARAGDVVLMKDSRVAVVHRSPHIERSQVWLVVTAYAERHVL